jgi:ABC-type bacteriocin/lantibiotic exporter with double-glycine peptidase domain
VCRKIISLVICLLPALSVPGQTQGTSGAWVDVPFVKQTEEGCGSAAISMLLQYWGAHGVTLDPGRADLPAIQEKLFSRKAHGIYASDMERYLKESGFRAFAYPGEWNDLREHIEKGRPLIISLQPRGSKTRFHYVVVAGIDWGHDALFVNDPARGKLLRLEREEFEREWHATGNWMLLAVPESGR